LGSLGSFSRSARSVWDGRLAPSQAKIGSRYFRPPVPSGTTSRKSLPAHHTALPAFGPMPQRHAVWIRGPAALQGGQFSLDTKLPPDIVFCFVGFLQFRRPVGAPSVPKSTFRGRSNLFGALKRAAPAGFHRAPPRRNSYVSPRKASMLILPSGNCRGLGGPLAGRRLKMAGRDICFCAGCEVRPVPTLRLFPPFACASFLTVRMWPPAKQPAWNLTQFVPRRKLVPTGNWCQGRISYVSEGPSAAPRSFAVWAVGH